MVSLQQKRYLTQLDIEWQSSWHHILRQDFLAPLAFKISRKALKLVFEQFKMVMAAYEARDKIGSRIYGCSNAQGDSSRKWACLASI